jgi:Spy/CpxP family protein refolding chaperone
MPAFPFLEDIMGRTKTRRFAFGVASALALAIGLVAATGAWAKGPGGYRGPGAKLERAIEKLELDEAKRAEVFGVIDAARPAGRELRERMRASHEQMRALIESGSASEADVLAMADEVGALRTELQKHQLRTLLQVRERLSAEQQAQLSEAMSKRHCKGRQERRHVL